MIRSLLKRAVSWLDDLTARRSNPMLADPAYSVLHKAIQERRRKHLPVRDLLEQKRQLVHRALAHRRAA